MGKSPYSTDVIAPRLLAICVLIALPSAAWGKDCVDWPRVMGMHAAAGQTAGPVIVIEEFTNFTKNPEDDWLAAGYRDFVAALLETSERARVRSGHAARYDPAAKQPRYLVSGKFQHLADKLRIFIELKDGASMNLIRMVTVETPYPDNAALFTETARAVRELAGAMNITFTEKTFEMRESATASTRAFENYARGQQAFSTYNPKQLDVAKIWFEQTKKADIHSWLGYEGLIDLYTFQGLRAKLEGKSFIPYYQQAEEELVLMNKLAKRPPAVPRWGRPKAQKRRDEEVKLTNRFLRGHAAFLRGVDALSAGDVEAAVGQLRQAAAAVPEDAVAWNELSRAYARAGRSGEASEARAKAKSINPCLP